MRKQVPYNTILSFHCPTNYSNIKQITLVGERWMTYLSNTETEVLEKGFYSVFKTMVITKSVASLNNDQIQLPEHCDRDLF